METLCSVFREYYSPEEVEKVDPKDTDGKEHDLENCYFWEIHPDLFY